ncbi:methyltransferase [Planobispora siamensis]|uniref:SAM-dependent methyltransferase n=1 Tax=Planobispora siamensis TaxID=936338 RepID=A0A8J3WR41_9ACTN|nr:methyltransferase [Planobispora siamensis]GIH97682.1 SAM-dependent methyltransferase [Planobispora siamensis]
MPLHLSAAEARSFLQTHDAPAPWLDVLSAMTCHAAVAALRLGVFDALAQAAPRTAGELAAQLGADPHGLGVLLDLLVRTGYLAEEHGGYANGPAATAWITPATRGEYAQTMAFWHDVMTGLWPDLMESLRTGIPAADFYSWLAGRPGTLRAFHDLQDRIASSMSQEVARLADLPQECRLLDLGGGRATHAIALCRAHPGRRATVVDHPATVALGRPAVAAAGLAAQIVFHPGDLLRLGPEVGRHDAVLLFNVLHGMAEEPARTLIDRAAGLLTPGGRLVVLDIDPHGAPSGTQEPGSGAHEVFLRGFELNLLHTQGGRLYTPQELGSWLGEAGLRPSRPRHLRSQPGQFLLTAS